MNQYKNIKIIKKETINKNSKIFRFIKGKNIYSLFKSL